MCLINSCSVAKYEQALASWSGEACVVCADCRAFWARQRGAARSLHVKALLHREIDFFPPLSSAAMDSMKYFCTFCHFIYAARPKGDRVPFVCTLTNSVAVVVVVLFSFIVFGVMFKIHLLFNKFL